MFFFWGKMLSSVLLLRFYRLKTLLTGRKLVLRYKQHLYDHRDPVCVLNISVEKTLFRSCSTMQVTFFLVFFVSDSYNRYLKERKCLTVTGQNRCKWSKFGCFVVQLGADWLVFFSMDLFTLWSFITGYYISIFMAFSVVCFGFIVFILARSIRRMERENIFRGISCCTGSTC